MTGHQAAIAACRASWDALEASSVADLRLARELLHELGDEELRDAVVTLSRMLVGLVRLLADVVADFDVDDWFASLGLEAARKAEAG